VKATISAKATVAQQPGIKRTVLQQHDLSSPGREAVHVRIDFELGASFPNHVHTGEEVIYVIGGFLKYQVARQASVTLKAGDLLFMPADTVHSAKNIGNAGAAELATYVVEKGKPLVVIVKRSNRSKSV